MLSLHDQSVGMHKMAVEKDPLVGIEFDDEIDQFFRPINIEHREHEMLEIAQFEPADIAIIEAVGRIPGSAGSCHGCLSIVLGWHITDSVPSCHGRPVL